MPVKKRKYVRKKKKKIMIDEVLPKKKPKPVDPVKLQYPKPLKNQPFGICRNRARNVEQALKEEK